jgi:hypothetical protein
VLVNLNTCYFIAIQTVWVCALGGGGGVWGGLFDYVFSALISFVHYSSDHICLVKIHDAQFCVLSFHGRG